MEITEFEGYTYSLHNRTGSGSADDEAESLNQMARNSRYPREIRKHWAENHETGVLEMQRLGSATSVRLLGRPGNNGSISWLAIADNVMCMSEDIVLKSHGIGIICLPRRIRKGYPFGKGRLSKHASKR